MPVTSEARIKANLENCRKSSGPRSPEGKANSRKNGLKHGLSGAGVVLADCDAPEVERRTEALLDQFDPQSTLGKLLIGNLATFSVRMERGAVEELAMSASRVRHAVETFDYERIDRAEALFDTLPDDPRKHLRLLKRMPEGVDRLVEGWGELRGELTRLDGAKWDDSHEAMATSMLGFRPGQIGSARVEDLSKAVRGEGSLADIGWCSLDREPGKVWARDRLVELIDEQIAALEKHRETLDVELIEMDRDEAPARASFDTSKDGTRFRRYASEASRLFFKTLKEFHKAEAEAAERPARPEVPKPVPTPTPAPEPARSSGSLASSWEKPSPAVREPEPIPFDGPLMPIERVDGQARGLDGRVLAVGRAVGKPG